MVSIIFDGAELLFWDSNYAKFPGFWKIPRTTSWTKEKNLKAASNVKDSKNFTQTNIVYP